MLLVRGDVSTYSSLELPRSSCLPSQLPERSSLSQTPNKLSPLSAILQATRNTAAAFWALQTLCNVGQLLLLACHALRQLGHHSLSRRLEHPHSRVQDCLLL